MYMCVYVHVHTCTCTYMYIVYMYVHVHVHTCTQGCGNSEPIAGHFDLFSTLLSCNYIQLSFNLPDIH